MGDERSQIVAAIARAVAEYGYAGVRMDSVLRQAEVSDDRFRAHFTNLEQGLVAAQEAFLEQVRLEVALACDLDRPWTENVCAALNAVLVYVTEASDLARGFTVEATASSLAASERHYAALAALADLLRQGRRFHPRAEEMPDAVEQALIGGIASIVSARLLTEEPQTLLDLEPQFAEFLLLPYLGRAEAGRVARP
jgi:AcrR family transcriptional regulator